jgi:hypothetical protein
MSAHPEVSFSVAGFKRPTCDRRGARGILGLEEWQLEPILDSGRIRGVVNIASPGARRAELRFLIVAVKEHQRGIVTERTDEKLAAAIFGNPRPFVRAHWVYSRLGCTPKHFYNLAAERVIPLAKDSLKRGGPGSGAIVNWKALVAFIAKRRIA